MPLGIDKIKTILVDQREEVKRLFSQEKIIARDIETKNITRYLVAPNIVVVSGIRRSGKSTLALAVLKNKKHLYLNFDDERLADFSPDDFDLLLQAGYELYGEDLNYFLFDEIQNIGQWQLFINRLRRTKKIIITGSNARLLSGELATHLTGRYVKVELFPFSFREFLRLKGLRFVPKDIFSTAKKAKLRQLFEEYLKKGGLPEVYKFGQKMVQQIYSDILNKDILLRYPIKQQRTFKKLANYLMAQFTNSVSFANLGKIFSIQDAHTVSNYIDYLINSYLIFVLHKFSYKLKQQHLAKKKLYGIDTGLINSVAFQFSQNKGRLVENAVFIELLRRISYWNQFSEVFFWQDLQGREVDFVIKKGRKFKQLIQVSTDVSSQSIWQREIRSLLIASKKLHCDNLLLLTANERGEKRVEGQIIRIRPLAEWFLFARVRTNPLAALN